MKRRTALKLALGLTGALLVAPRALAIGEATAVSVVELELGGGDGLRPEAWGALLGQVELTTSVETTGSSHRANPGDLGLFEHPLAVMSGSSSFPPLSTEAVSQLRAYLSYGGFLFIDDTSGLESSGFDESVRRMMARLFPSRSLVPLPSDHSLYRAFFLIERPLGRVDTHRWLEGLTIGETTRVVYSRNDLSGALVRGSGGRHLFSPTPGGERQRREALKLGINLVMYALTSNYKRDQAHVRQLMEEGRLE